MKIVIKKWGKKRKDWKWKITDSTPTLMKKKWKEKSISSHGFTHACPLEKQSHTLSVSLSLSLSLCPPNSSVGKFASFPLWITLFILGLSSFFFLPSCFWCWCWCWIELRRKEEVIDTHTRHVCCWVSWTQQHQRSTNSWWTLCSVQYLWQSLRSFQKVCPSYSPCR